MTTGEEYLSEVVQAGVGRETEAEAVVDEAGTCGLASRATCVVKGGVGCKANGCQEQVQHFKKGAKGCHLRNFGIFGYLTPSRNRQMPLHSIGVSLAGLDQSGSGCRDRVPVLKEQSLALTATLLPTAVASGQLSSPSKLHPDPLDRLRKPRHSYLGIQPLP